MKRSSFLKKMFAGIATFTIAPSLLASDLAKKEYSFDEIFTVWPKNPRLIYPKKESTFYRELENILKGKINPDGHPTYLPVHSLSIPYKEKYTADELKPLKFYFESSSMLGQKLAIQKDVCFRMIRDKEDRMHLDLFLNYRY